MAANTLLVKSYAQNIYKLGINTFENIQATRPDYVLPVKQRAADYYYIDDIDDALTNGYINAEQHAETLALKGAEDPQERPPYELMAMVEGTV